MKLSNSSNPLAQFLHEFLVNLGTYIIHCEMERYVEERRAAYLARQTCVAE